LDQVEGERELLRAGENFLLREKLGEGGESAAGSMVGANILSRMGVFSDYGLHRRGDQGTKDKSLIMVRLMMLAKDLNDKLQI
jgi:hypothetical protein